VKVAASGRAARILRSHAVDTVTIDGLCIRYEGGAMRFASTLGANAQKAPSAFARNMNVALNHVLDFGPTVVLTDFDSFAWSVGRLLRLPIVSIDHQHVLDRFRHPLPLRTRLSRGFVAARAFVAAKTPRCDSYVVTSFFFPEVRRRYATTTSLVGPIVRPEIERAVSTPGDHVLVYQTANGDPRLLPTLTATRGARFVVYGLGRDANLGNVELRSFDEERFVRDLASARAVIANGGFTTLSEAIYLGKPVLSVPMRHQGEQELNAAWLEALGLGRTARRFSPAVVAGFLARLDDYRVASDPRIRRGTVDACASLDRAFAEAA
jgi:uncharacterized protein (TIGR00661 family)